MRLNRADVGGVRRSHFRCRCETVNDNLEVAGLEAIKECIFLYAEPIELSILIEAAVATST